MTEIKKEKEQKKSTEEGEMSFLEHLEELRWHIMRSVIAIVLLGIVAFIFNRQLFEYIIYGPTEDWFPTFKLFCKISESMCFTPPELQILTLDLGEAFLLSIQLAFWIGFIVAFPYVFYQFWSFIKPGLYEKEQKAARGMVLICSSLFLGGVVFGYFGITPFAVKFLGSFDIGLETTRTVSVKSLMGYITMISIPAGLIFQLPVVIYFLAKVGLVSSDFLRKYRRLAYVIILIVAAIITPPDVTTQFLIGIPVFGLYEISISIAKRVEKKNAKALAKT